MPSLAEHLQQLVNAAQDGRFRHEVGQGLSDTFNRGLVGGGVGAPADLTNMLLRGVGLGVDKPVMGSEWLGDKMQQAGVVSGKRNLLAETLAGLVDPITAGAGVAKVAGAMPAIVGMAMNARGKIRLGEVLNSWQEGTQASGNLRGAIDLTSTQQSELQNLLRQQYPTIEVPSAIPYKARHAYDSRVLKDGFSAADVQNWSVSGAADNAKAIEHQGRAALLNIFDDVSRGKSYDVRMPIRGDALGNVWADDVIPVGLFGNKAPKRNPLTPRSALTTELPNRDVATDERTIPLILPKTQ